jgi:aryl-alcohol dehydrogenase-like predicted oxidoreductase
VLDRREFNAICVALSSVVTSSGPSTLDAATDPTGAGRSVKFRDGTVVSALGQGSARLAHGRRPQAEEEEALRTGLSLGMTLIDTAESYGSEELIGRVIAGRRDRVFLVSKVISQSRGGNGIARACDASLTRLGTDYLDLYLLHWPNGITDFAGLVTAFENLRSAGKIRAWAVSNFNVNQLQKLFRVPQGDRCATNQVPYRRLRVIRISKTMTSCGRFEVSVSTTRSISSDQWALTSYRAAAARTV